MGASAWSWSLTRLYQSPHHIRPDCRQGELGALVQYLLHQPKKNPGQQHCQGSAGCWPSL
jgi:hypothetical protein